MGVFEDTIVKAKDVVDTAAKKGGEFISLQKLKIEASRMNAQLSKDYEALGRAVYANLASGEAPDDAADEILATIKAHQAELLELEKQISENKGTIICDTCGAVCAADAVFCSKCGKKL